MPRAKDLDGDQGRWSVDKAERQDQTQRAHRPDHGPDRDPYRRRRAAADRRVGKIRLYQAAPRAHWWQVPFHLTDRGITSRPTGRDVMFSIDFDFADPGLVLNTLAGQTGSFPLPGLSVAAFHELHRAVVPRHPRPHRGQTLLSDRQHPLRRGRHAHRVRPVLGETAPAGRWGLCWRSRPPGATPNPTREYASRVTGSTASGCGTFSRRSG
ncbi:DUF5996 family protein [Micromonospora sp. NPDC004551]|uniref:DUF5996 family protein n=1 Tax=Micromonospora sp. NPDC004551 TaxID=3154284 RepID=UPI0033A740A0